MRAPSSGRRLRSYSVDCADQHSRWLGKLALAVSKGQDTTALTLQYFSSNPFAREQLQFVEQSYNKDLSANVVLAQTFILLGIARFRLKHRWLSLIRQIQQHYLSQTGAEAIVVGARDSLKVVKQLYGHYLRAKSRIGSLPFQLILYETLQEQARSWSQEQGDQFYIPCQQRLVSPAPYLRFPQRRPFTLVLDLDQTLTHFSSKLNRMLIRPGAKLFLAELEPFYELILFTSAIRSYALEGAKLLAGDGLFSYVLSREHTYPGKILTKDLRRLGRDMRKTLIIDNMKQNFEKHPENGIWVKEWKGDRHDDSLSVLKVLLLELAGAGLSDLRRAIGLIQKTYQQQTKR